MCTKYHYVTYSTKHDERYISFDLYIHDDIVLYNSFFYMRINVFQIPEKTYFKWLGFKVSAAAFRI
jgi:hypothetical protein